MNQRIRRQHERNMINYKEKSSKKQKYYDKYMEINMNDVNLLIFKIFSKFPYEIYLKIFKYIRIHDKVAELFYEKYYLESLKFTWRYRTILFDKSINELEYYSKCLKISFIPFDNQKDNLMIKKNQLISEMNQVFEY